MTILCYHTVEPDWDQKLAVPPDEFEAQCRWLVEHRRVVPVDRIVDQLDERWRPRGGLSAITFDDGWSGVHTHAWPILRRHGLPFTVFVVAETLTDDRRDVHWVLDPPERPMEVLDLEQVRELHAAGVDIASHSLHHADLTSLSYADCVADLRESREVIEDAIGGSVRTVAYPSGRHDADVRRAARAAGYVAGFSLPERREAAGPYAIPRVGVYPANSRTTFRIKTHERYLDLRLSPWWDRARPLLRRVRSR